MMRTYALVLATVATGIFMRQPSTAEHAQTAMDAASNAAQAAQVAQTVASHAVSMHDHAQTALKHAQDAVQNAQTSTEGLSDASKESLKKADDALGKASEKLSAEELEQAEWLKKAKQEELERQRDQDSVASLRAQIADLEKRLDAASDATEAAQYKAEMGVLKSKLEEVEARHAASSGTGESLGKLRDELAKLQSQLETMEDIESLRSKLQDVKEDAADKAEVQELSKELEEMQKLLKELEEESVKSGKAADSTAIEEELQRLKEAVAAEIAAREARAQTTTAAPKAAESGWEKSEQHMDVDTQMPYGELAPFGRENTAQELTEASIRESDKMVDQLERAEVAEEKRAVFRSLTRLRGAAITSFDGIARSQTGNIDEYAQTQKWREEHPLQHLADEESDVSKWAFPRAD